MCGPAALVVGERSGLAHFAEADVGAFLVAVVEADEAAGLERFAPRDGFLVARARRRRRA